MDILNQFGISPVLLTAQVVNFLVLLFILKKLLYGPLLKVLAERRKKIEDSLKNAEEIELRLQETNEKIDKMLSIYVPEIEMKKIDDLVKEFSIDPRIHVQKLTAWDKRLMSLDITSNMASKQHGILEVAKILHISTEEIIGVGDGYNDFPLLMACGLKIAMGNAVPELKAIADFIAPTVEEDGVATVIEKFVLTA